MMNSRHVLSLLVPLLFFACDKRELQTTAGGPVTVTVLLTDGTAELSMSPNADGPAKFLMFLPMVEFGPDGSLEGRLAQSWVPSPGVPEWTVHLNQGVRWHDGTPVTSSDIAFTIELMTNPNVGFLNYSGVEIEIIDDSTFIWKSSAITPLEGYATFYPKHLLEDLDPERFWEWDFWAAPVGNGPYRYVRHVDDLFTELEANSDYFAGPPAIDRVILKYGAPEGGAIPELLAGNVQAHDHLLEPPAPDLHRSAHTPRGHPGDRPGRSIPAPGSAARASGVRRNPLPAPGGRAARSHPIRPFPGPPIAGGGRLARHGRERNQGEGR